MSWGSCSLPLESAQPPSHFLVRAGSLEVIAVLSQTPSSNSNSCYYAIIRGRGKGKSRGENRERGEWGIDRMHSNKWKQMERKEARQHNSEGSCALYSTTSTRKNEDQGQHLWLVYKDLLKGGSTLISRPSFLASYFDKFVPQPIGFYITYWKTIKNTKNCQNWGCYIT